MITVGHIAKMYGMLPSQVIAQATAHDIMIADVYTTWEGHKSNPTDIKDYSQEQLQDILDKSRNA